MARSKKRFKRGYKERFTSSEKLHMLDLKREPYVKYDINEILTNSTIEDKQKDTLQATTINKASKNSIENAEEYLDLKLEEGIIDEDTRDKIARILNRNSRRR